MSVFNVRRLNQTKTQKFHIEFIKCFQANKYKNKLTLLIYSQTYKSLK